jgi:hypothetical protein
VKRGDKEREKEKEIGKRWGKWKEDNEIGKGTEEDTEEERKEGDREKEERERRGKRWREMRKRERERR